MDGRETMRPTGSPIQGVDMGGRQRSDGEGQQDEVSNPLASSAAAPPSAVEMAEVIMRVIKETEARTPIQARLQGLRLDRRLICRLGLVFLRREKVSKLLSVCSRVRFWMVERRRIGWCARKP